MKNYNKTKLLALVALPTLLSATVLAPLAGATTLTSKNWRFEVPITGPTPITAPGNISIDSAGNFWVGNTSANTVQEIKKVGTSYVPQAPLSGSGATALSFPTAAAADSHGNVWVANTYGNSIEEFTLSGSTYTAQNPITGFDAPTSVRIDASDNLWVVNSGTLFNGSGSGSIQEVIKVSGTWTPQTPITTSDLVQPYDLTLDGANKIWVATEPDGTSQGGYVLLFTKSGSTWSQTSKLNGTGGNAFEGPQGVVADKSGSVWVMNFGGNSIQEIAKSGSTYTVEAPIASEGHPFDQPNGIVIDPKGNLWVANWNSNSIQEITFIPTAGLASTGFSALNFTIGASLLLIFGVVATRTSRRKLAL